MHRFTTGYAGMIRGECKGEAGVSNDMPSACRTVRAYKTVHALQRRNTTRMNLLACIRNAAIVFFARPVEAIHRDVADHYAASIEKLAPEFLTWCAI